MACPDFQPCTFWHHARVAGGSVLASSVCVMTPARTLGAAALRGDSTALLGRRVVARFFATFFVLFPTDFGLAMGSSWSSHRDPSPRPCVGRSGSAPHRIPSCLD